VKNYILIKTTENCQSAKIKYLKNLYGNSVVTVNSMKGFLFVKSWVAIYQLCKQKVHNKYNKTLGIVGNTQ